MPLTDAEAKKLIVRDGASALVRPGLTLTLYSPLPLRKASPGVADVLETYLAAIPPGALQGTFGHDGTYVKLPKTRIPRELKLLRRPPRHYEHVMLDHQQKSSGGAGDYAFYYEASARKDKLDAEKTSLLRLEFPHVLSGEDWVDAVAKAAELYAFESGNAGYAFKRTQMLSAYGSAAVLRLLPRWHAFDPSYTPARRKMKGRTFMAHWINLLGGEVLEKLGGEARARKALPKAEIRRLKNGILIRAAKLPPVGRAFRPDDLGLLPDVARFLAPLRVDLKGLGAPRTVFDAPAWLARFDKMKCGPWDNA